MSVKCLSISHKIRKRIESLDKGMLNAQKMFECAINKHKFDSIWILRPLQRQRWPFKENLISRGASFIAPSSRNVVRTINLLATLMDQDPGHGVLWSNMTHYLAILYTAAIIYPCSVLTMTASYPYTRLEIPTPPFISLFTDFMRRTE